MLLAIARSDTDWGFSSSSSAAAAAVARAVVYFDGWRRGRPSARRPLRVPPMRDCCNACQWAPRIRKMASRNLCPMGRILPARGRPAQWCTVLSKNYSDFFLPSSGDAAAGGGRAKLPIHRRQRRGREANASSDSSHPTAASGEQPNHAATLRTPPLQCEDQLKKRERARLSARPSPPPSSAISRSLSDGRSDRRPRALRPSD